MTEGEGQTKEANGTAGSNGVASIDPPPEVTIAPARDSNDSGLIKFRLNIIFEHNFKTVYLANKAFYFHSDSDSGVVYRA